MFLVSLSDIAADAVSADYYYGFNLHSDPTRHHYVRYVDEGSPAKAAGLMSSDRILEVNGCSVDGESRDHVAAAFKAVAGEVQLLVIDSDADELRCDKEVQTSPPHSSTDPMCMLLTFYTMLFALLRVGVSKLSFPRMRVCGTVGVL